MRPPPDVGNHQFQGKHTHPKREHVNNNNKHRRPPPGKTQTDGISSARGELGRQHPPTLLCRTCCRRALIPVRPKVSPCVRCLFHHLLAVLLIRGPQLCNENVEILFLLLLLEDNSMARSAENSPQQIDARPDETVGLLFLGWTPLPLLMF